MKKLTDKERQGIQCIANGLAQFCMTIGKYVKVSEDMSNDHARGEIGLAVNVFCDGIDMLNEESGGDDAR